MSDQEQLPSMEDLLGPPRPLEPTGIPNLDQILGGGLPRGALAIIVGPPGSGKTTLANQMAFAAAQAGQRVMVLTALSEPTSKLIAHLSAFDFFDDDLVGDNIQFLSLQQFLSGGLEETSAKWWRRLAARRLRGARRLSRGARREQDPQAARQFLYDVGTTLSVLGATTIITSEADPRDPAVLSRGDHRRCRHWLAFRCGWRAPAAPGGDHQNAWRCALSGLHGLALGQAGMIVYPRLESKINQTAYAPQPDSLGDVLEDLAVALGDPEARDPFGLPALDALLGGGVTPGTSTMVMGSLGTGKTLLGLHFALEGVRRGEPTVFLGFRESYHQLLRKTYPFVLGQELRAALAPEGPFTLLRWPPVELNADTLATVLLETLDRTNAKRLVVDSITELERAAMESGDPRRVENYLAALMEALHRRNVTALFIREIPSSGLHPDFSSEPVAILAENMLVLRQEERQGRLHRTLLVQKMRFSAYDATIVREFTIHAPEGIRVQEDVGNDPVPPSE